nr:A-kinase-interacting protein 1 isoform X3 [Oryctolagus cuniculus]
MAPTAPVPSGRPRECALGVKGDMESCLAAAALNGVDRRSLQRSARLGQEVLERAKRRAVDWHSQERPRGSTGVLSWEGPYHARRPPAGPLCLLPGEREERHPTLSASFRTMAEFMDYTSSQCGTPAVPQLGQETKPGTQLSTFMGSGLLEASVACQEGRNITHLCQKKEGPPTSVVITEGSQWCTCVRKLGMVREKTEGRQLLVLEAASRHQSIPWNPLSRLRTSLRTST